MSRRDEQRDGHRRDQQDLHSGQYDEQGAESIRDRLVQNVYSMEDTDRGGERS